MYTGAQRCAKRNNSKGSVSTFQTRRTQHLWLSFVLLSTLGGNKVSMLTGAYPAQTLEED